MRLGIALDIGTSGFRCQALDLDSGRTVATAVTERHPIPGMNVIDHVNYAMKVGEEAVELVIASKDDDKDLFLGEAADLVYHFLVLLAQKDTTLAEVIDVLKDRHSR